MSQHFEWWHDTAKPKRKHITSFDPSARKHKARESDIPRPSKAVQVRSSSALIPIISILSSSPSYRCTEWQCPSAMNSGQEISVSTHNGLEYYPSYVSPHTCRPLTTVCIALGIANIFHVSLLIIFSIICLFPSHFVGKNDWHEL